MKANTFRDLMGKHKSAEIRCLYTGNLVRRLTLDGDKVIIDALQPPILSVPLDAIIVYSPWVMDRGNMLFRHDEMPGQDLKICGEDDRITYEDGSQDRIGKSDHRSFDNADDIPF